MHYHYVLLIKPRDHLNLHKFISDISKAIEANKQCNVFFTLFLAALNDIPAYVFFDGMIHLANGIVVEFVVNCRTPSKVV